MTADDQIGRRLRAGRCDTHAVVHRMKKREKLPEDSVQPLPTVARSTAHGAAWRGLN
jgi:hypothetical protein